MTFTKQEKRMLIEAAKSFRQADKDSIGMGYYNNGVLIDKEFLKRWDVILRKLREGKTNEKSRQKI